jgi:hypothetical protein
MGFKICIQNQSNPRFLLLKMKISKGIERIMFFEFEFRSFSNFYFFIMLKNMKIYSHLYRIGTESITKIELNNF